MNMETLNLKGTNLHYHKLGQGPVLILIPGANGTGDIFLPMAKILAEDYTVIAVDRRGFGQSHLTAPLPAEVSSSKSEYRVKQDAKDIARLAEHESKDAPVNIFGTSTGAIIAMHLLQDYPDIVKTAALHEPLINSILPDAKYWQDKNQAIVETENDEGMSDAMELLGETLRVTSLDQEMMTQPAEDAEDEVTVQHLKEMENWFEYELRQYSASQLTIEKLRMLKEKIILLNGTDAAGSFPQEVNNYLATALSIEINKTQGGHLGYVQEPHDFAETLKKIYQ